MESLQKSGTRSLTSGTIELCMNDDAFSKMRGDNPGLDYPRIAQDT